MTCRRGVLALACLALTACLTPAEAAEATPFSAAAFEAAQKGGKPILVAVSAPWCPICKTQKPILAKLAAEPRFKELQIFDIDFDSQKDLLRRFNARMQSTLIVFKGATETGRSVGETQPEWIEGLLEKAL
ncbi:thioredoxin family protein [Methylobacterium brachiatum]|jgi:thioredoxin 1|uniref:Thiol-disulfide isomerase/thioredoxin n=1 Tax=Methylobacterium brachiatum TaxID=269660 RepID=A0AAJ1TNB2_9HYPH|nr:thioredoxin family protein [Methylobacterium brachiatum]AYO86090.1 thioredoxin [Methylobacterium brachiatum]MCB4803434.1 thioredoxin family protein [Methylobacterium brachiatum]MDQ0541869.1 thiol-disulfide isomerase/thioredoxin [Methylobacterium brachiatum]